MTRHARLGLAAALFAAMPAANALDAQGLDLAVDPCTSFYMYANHKWLDTHEIPPDRSWWGAVPVVRKLSDDQLMRIFEDAARAPLPPEGSAARKVIQYYRSGMDEAQIRGSQSKPLAGLLGTIGQLDDGAAMARLVGELHAHGIFPGFHFEVDVDRRDSSRRLAQISQGGLGLPDRDYYFLDDERSRQVRAAYREHLVNVLRLDGEDEKTASADAATIYEIEAELAKASMTRVERRDVEKTYNKMTPAELEKLAPGFAWGAYFAVIRASQLADIGVNQPAFATRFAQLVSERPIAQWRPYLRWQLLQAASDKLDTRYEALHFDFYQKTLRGLQQPPPRAKRVLDIISGPYGTEPLAEAIGQMYVRDAFPPSAKARAAELVRNVKAALADRLKTVDWMSEPTRAVSLEKLAAMRVKIGYPDRWKDLSAANVGDKPFVDNWMLANRFEHDRNLARLGKPVDRGEWIVSPHIVNAFYNPNFNEIVFPAAILQPPFFDAKADDAANYGAIGAAIGHEITHGFDDRGRLFDKDGNLRDWWSADDARRYKERAAKVEAQYGDYTGIDGIKVNGALTLGENISDVGGLKIAYLALQKALEGAPRGKIDGLAPEQRFFLSYAQSNAAKFRPDFERMILRTDPHSPGAFRVLGTTTNMPEFAQAFSCDAGKALLPDNKRANIW